MKKILLMICAGMLTLASCMNDNDAVVVPSTNFTAKNLPAPTTTIAELRAKYNTQINNSSYKMITEDVVVEGIVVANDISGNIYQFVYIQDINEDGTSKTNEGGIAVGVKGIGCLYTLFPVGQRIRVNLKNLYIGGYGASPRIGMPYINTNGANRMGPMPLSYLATNIELIGTPNAEKVVAREITEKDLTDNNIEKITPMLVSIKNARINDEGKPYAHWTVGGDTYSETHDVFINGKRQWSLLYISTSATFAGDIIPNDGEKEIYGLLGRYTKSYQLTPRSKEDVEPKK